MSRMVASTFGLAALLCAAFDSRADDSPKGHVSVRFLTELNAVPLTVDTDSFAAWVKPVIAAVEARYLKDEARKSIVVQITLYRDKPAEIELAGNPKLSDEDVKAITAAADPARSPRTKLATCSFRVVANDKENKPDDLPGLTPALETPYGRLLGRVRTAPTREALELIKRWAVEESLPLLAASAVGAEEKFAGVRNLGDAIKKALADPKKPLSAEALASKNPDFWRATLEMQPGNPLAPAVETSLLIAEGRVEWAHQISGAARMFDGGRSGPSALMGFGRALSEAYLKGVNDRILKGIALHDRGELEEARAAFDAILKDDPQSAWAIYERFHTDRTIAIKAKGAPIASGLWPRTRTAILASNPLYATMGEANGAEGIFDLTRRMAISGLFKDGQASVKDVVAYADVALDLQAFDLAAMLYWSLASRIDPKAYDDRPLLESFLYALERLGVKDVKSAFKGDHAAAFAAIEADRRKRVEAGLNPPKPDAAKAEPKPAGEGGSRP